MRHAIGIDLGGTNIKAALVNESGRILDRISRETNDCSSSIKDWSEIVATIIRQFEAVAPPSGSYPIRIGVASPGLAASDHRSIAFLPGKLHGLERFDWTAYLQRDELVPVLNDAHAALLGEAWVGAARHFKNVILLTLGTGVGGAIMLNGQLLRGAIGRAGHLGHTCLDMEGVPSIIGTPGSLEDAIGNRTVAQRTNGRFISTKSLVEAYLNGDAEASRVWLKSIHALGCAITSFLNILDPEAVIIGGGTARAGDALFKPLQAVLDDIEWRPGDHRTPVIPTELGEWAGAYGAAKHSLIPELRRWR
jgi:glucokinase